MLLATFVFCTLLAVSSIGEAGKPGTCTKESCGHKFDYCIIGAGPGGLQLGYFMMKQNMDYVIIERNGVAGSFFERYPRHRKLISINKRNTGLKNREFNFRHDWNSLCSDEFYPVFTDYTREYFPSPDLYLKYLQDYADYHRINIAYNTNMLKIEKGPGGKGFIVMTDPKPDYECRWVVLATGVNVGNKLANKYDLHGAIEYYHEVDVTPETFEGQTVFIFGHGNSGMEFATAIYPYANVVHLGGRTRIKLSWETHYVGDIRWVNYDNGTAKFEVIYVGSLSKHSVDDLNNIC